MVCKYLKCLFSLSVCGVRCIGVCQHDVTLWCWHGAAHCTAVRWSVRWYTERTLLITSCLSHPVYHRHMHTEHASSSDDTEQLCVQAQYSIQTNKQTNKYIIKGKTHLYTFFRIHKWIEHEHGCCKWYCDLYDIYFLYLVLLFKPLYITLLYRFFCLRFPTKVLGYKYQSRRPWFALGLCDVSLTFLLQSLIVMAAPFKLVLTYFAIAYGIDPLGIFLRGSVPNKDFNFY